MPFKVASVYAGRLELASNQKRVDSIVYAVLEEASGMPYPETVKTTLDFVYVGDHLIDRLVEKVDHGRPLVA